MLFRTPDTRPTLPVRWSSPFRLLAAMCMVCMLAPALLAANAVTVTGTVTNGTTGKPSDGDAVVLIALTQQMQEVAHTTTDASGRYSLSSAAQGMHLIRVDHEGTSYFKPVAPGAKAVDVTVFDAAAAVPGVSTEANVIRMESSNGRLTVIQSFFVKNGSNPPRTQNGKHSYPFYLPAGAEIDESAAMGPDGMPVKSVPSALGKKGYYAFAFPLRPGETQFQVTYHLPYSGSLTFAPRLAAPAGDFVVMLPDTMKFQAAPEASFEVVNQPTGAQTYVIRNATTKEDLGFTVSGSGQLPQEIQGSGGGSSAESSSQANENDRPGIGLGKPIDTPYPLSKYKWWILGALALLFAAGAGMFLRRPVQPQTATQAAPAPAPAPADEDSEIALLRVLKDEMFAIETDRATGKLSEADYLKLKKALDLLIERAHDRQPV